SSSNTMTDAIAPESGRRKPKAARGGPVKKKSSKRATSGSGAVRADRAHTTVARIADLARSGQHLQAIEAATRALDVAGLEAAARLDILDLRAESCVALGDLGPAAADAAAMIVLAKTAKSAAFTAQAYNRQALIDIRKSEIKAALASATTALEGARRSKRSR